MGKFTAFLLGENMDALNEGELRKHGWVSPVTLYFSPTAMIICNKGNQQC